MSVLCKPYRTVCGHKECLSAYLAATSWSFPGLPDFRDRLPCRLCSHGLAVFGDIKMQYAVVSWAVPQLYVLKNEPKYRAIVIDYAIFFRMIFFNISGRY
jgi:hypothetical protein